MKQTARKFAPVESLAVMYSTTPFVTRFGPALGVYAGPGSLGIALLQAGR